MIEHLVLFQLKPDADQSGTSGTQAMIDAIQGLRQGVPGIVDLSVGRNFSERNRGYDIGLAVRFETRQALEAYGVHPEHERVVREFIRPNTTAVLVVDYEF